MQMVRLGIKLANPIYSFIKKALLVFIVFYAVISIFIYFFKSDSKKINVQQSTTNEQAIIYSKITDPELLKTTEGQIQIGLYRGFMCGLVGEACTNNPEDAEKYRDQSLFGRVTNWVAAPYSVPPASGLVWVQNGLQEAGFVPSAYAAEGIGFSSIKGYIDLWKLFRNIAFLLLVLVMLIIGFLIMFRVKIDPQTVISIENVLPRIVVTMIFISLSFAIAGFLIDIMYTLIGVCISLIMGYGQGADRAAIMVAQDDLIGAKFHDLWPNGFGLGSVFGVGSSLWDMIPQEFKGILNLVIVRNLTMFFAYATFLPWEPLLSASTGAGVNGSILGFGGGANAGQIVTGLLKWGLYAVASGLLAYILPGLILGFIIILTILLLMFKIFFMLLTSYIKVILYVIFAPVIILMEAFPGQNTFSWWIKNLIGELIVFPTVIVIMLVGNAILSINSGGFWFNFGSTYALPKSNDTFLLPFLYGFNPADFNMIVSLGIILLIPDLIKIVKGWIGVSDVPLNLSLGTFLQGGSVILGGALGGASTLSSWRSSLVGHDPYHGLLDSLPLTQGLAKQVRKFSNIQEPDAAKKVHSADGQ